MIPSEHYNASTVPQEDTQCVVSILDPAALHGRIEFYIDLDYDIATMRHIIDKLPVPLFIERVGIYIHYPANRIQFIQYSEKEKV